MSEAECAVVRKEPSSGQVGVFASRAYAPLDVIVDFKGSRLLSKPERFTVQLDSERHIGLSPEWLQYINHSCDPNVFFDTTAMKLIALRSIEPNSEMRFFYPSTEWEMAEPFQCRCGAERCLGTISGAARLPKETLSLYRLSAFVRQKAGV